jgi:hypothetical protein
VCTARQAQDVNETFWNKEPVEAKRAFLSGAINDSPDFFSSRDVEITVVRTALEVLKKAYPGDNVTLTVVQNRVRGVHAQFEVRSLPPILGHIRA